MILLNRRHTLGLFASSFLTGCAGLTGDERPVVAMLLPQTGASAGLAESMRRTADPFGPSDKSPFEIRIFDTAGSRDGAAAAAAHAVSAKASLILGPVFAREVEPVVTGAGSIPVVTFSNDSGLIGSGAFVFGLTPSQSITAIFAFARAQGVRRISIVAYGHDWGRQSIAAANALAPRAGLAILKAISLSDTDDLSRLAAQIRQNGAPDAVVLADGGALLPELAQALSGSGVQILGTSQWSSLDLAAIPALHGAWFAAPDATGLDTVLSGPTPQRSQGRPAGLLPLLAHDGVTIAAALVGAGKISRAALLNAEGFATALGRVRFDADGAVERDLTILGVTPDGVTVLSKAAA